MFWLLLLSVRWSSRSIRVSSSSLVACTAQNVKNSNLLNRAAHCTIHSFEQGCQLLNKIFCKTNLKNRPLAKNLAQNKTYPNYGTN
jgi:hypothetical protein